jgi:hypothetical protein
MKLPSFCSAVILSFRFIVSFTVLTGGTW